MIFLSQRDPQWASTKLGASTLTVGRWGCTTTCISMLSDYFTCYRNPKELARNTEYYTKPGYAAGAGLILWGNLRFDNMKFDKRAVGPLGRGKPYEDYDAIDAALKDPKRAVILEVNDGAHWVVAYSKRLMAKNDYIIIDPWDGAKKRLRATYRNITGAAYFSAK